MNFFRQQVFSHKFLKKGIPALLASVLTGFGVIAIAGDYTDRSDVQQFIDELVREHEMDGEQLKAWMAGAEKKQSILDAISRPAEKTKPWHEYRNIFLQEDRINQGVEFWQQNADTLAAVSQQYGVPEEIIVAIIGVEPKYGRITGSYRVIDSLSTLAFDYPPRGAFFRKQLKEFFLLAREQKQDPTVLKGSYAGAMGYGQFIPSSYRHYAVDQDEDGFADIWNNPVDAVGSVANYFSEHGWQQGKPIITRCRVDAKRDPAAINMGLKPNIPLAELAEKGYPPVTAMPDDEPLSVYQFEGEQGAEFWVGAKNFYVITRYNHSKMYALAVYQLSQAIKQHKETSQ